MSLVLLFLTTTLIVYLSVKAALARSFLRKKVTLPAEYGLQKAAVIACWFMAVPQFFVVALLITEGANWQAIVVSLLIGAQLLAMAKLVKNPEELAPWYNGTGVMAYVSGMMVTATALSSMAL